MATFIRLTRFERTGSSMFSTVKTPIALNVECILEIEPGEYKYAGSSETVPTTDIRTTGGAVTVAEDFETVMSLIPLPPSP